MKWFDVVKSSPCLREAKQMFYEVMEKLGANDELLREIKNAPEDELIGMIEDLQMEMSGKPEEKIFEKIVINFERCEQEALINPIPQASMGQDFQSDFQDKLASEKIEKTIRGKRLDPNMELILQRKLNSPKTALQINELFYMGLAELNKERLRNRKKSLSTRGIPPLQALPHLLKLHPKIKVIPPRTIKGASKYIWKE